LPVKLQIKYCNNIVVWVLIFSLFKKIIVL
jgi:hypothetical protein